jgi:hypothetical protein
MLQQKGEFDVVAVMIVCVNVFHLDRTEGSYKLDRIAIVHHFNRGFTCSSSNLVG